MSSRDKKLLVYLGALVILAVAYFFVGRPYLDKIEQLSNEKSQLQMELAHKREAFDKQEEYKTGIENANNRIQEIIDKFPEDNTDEKSIMFASHAEADIPIWFSQMNFATETQTLVNGEEVQSASDSEQEQLEENVAAAEGEETTPEEEGGSRGEITESAVGDLIGRDTELGLSYQVEYEDLKKFLEYIRDYKDRIVIKDITLSYSDYSDLVSGNVTLSQYAIIGEGRTLPDVVTDVEALGTDNVFKNTNEGGSIIDLLADIASDFLNKLMGGLGEEAIDEFGTDYFVKANAITDNTSGLTAGRADDVTGETYITDNTNDTQKVVFTVSGDSGKYKVRYAVGDTEYEDSIEKSTDGKVYLRIISTERASKKDKVAVALFIHNSADIPVIVNIEGDDRDNPRITISEKDGEVTVND